MRRKILSARDKALGMGHMERVGSELQYDLSKPLGLRGCQVDVGRILLQKLSHQRVRK